MSYAVAAAVEIVCAASVVSNGCHAFDWGYYHLEDD